MRCHLEVQISQRKYGKSKAIVSRYMLAKSYSLLLLSCICRAHDGFDSLLSVAVVVVCVIAIVYEDFRV